MLANLLDDDLEVRAHAAAWIRRVDAVGADTLQTNAETKNKTGRLSLGYTLHRAAWRIVRVPFCRTLLGKLLTASLLPPQAFFDGDAEAEAGVRQTLQRVHALQKRLRQLHASDAGFVEGVVPLVLHAANFVVDAPPADIGAPAGAPSPQLVLDLLQDLAPLLVKAGGTAAPGVNASVVGLYFSAHWCGPCRAFTPSLACGGHTPPVWYKRGSVTLAGTTPCS